jgi:hypothetical protein
MSSGVCLFCATKNIGESGQFIQLFQFSNEKEYFKLGTNKVPASNDTVLRPLSLPFSRFMISRNLEMIHSCSETRL